MITVLFLSGEFVSFDSYFQGATVYNLKRTICDWMEEKDENIDININLVHIYPYTLEELDEMDNSYPINEGETYRALIETVQRRIIFLKDNDNVYWRNEDEEDDDNSHHLASEEFSKLRETSNIQYYFDLRSFQRSWIRTYNFFTTHGYEMPRNRDWMLYPSEDEWEDEEEEWDWEDKRIALYTFDCVCSLFPKIQKIQDIQYMMRNTH